MTKFTQATNAQTPVVTVAHIGACARYSRTGTVVAQAALITDHRQPRRR
jgi:hypothetical protein